MLNSVECYCSNDRPSFKWLVDDGECSTLCDGDINEFCGGNSRLSVFQLPGGGSESVGDLWVGCFEESTNGRRFLERSLKVNWKQSIEACLSHCYNRAYRYAALYNGDSCSCGDGLEGGVTTSVSKCNVGCRRGEGFCGGTNTLSVYSTSIPGLKMERASCCQLILREAYTILVLHQLYTKVSTFQDVGEGKYLGCYFEGKMPEAKFILKESNTPARCTNLCFSLGHTLAATKLGVECYCGREVPWSRLKRDDSECRLSCPSDTNYFCGGTSTLSFYKAVQPTPTKVSESGGCQLSVTQVRGKKVCKGATIFSEDFNSINPQVWTNQIYMPSSPDYEFVVYDNEGENQYVKDGKLHIRPTVLSDQLVRNGKISLPDCTGAAYSEECSREAASFQILPPVQSASISTEHSFTFKYGIITVSAQLSQGDWITPEIRLRAWRPSYGGGYGSGVIRVIMGRGNERLVERKTSGGIHHLNNTRLESGLLVGLSSESVRYRLQPWLSSTATTSFHNYTLLWTPDNIWCQVDEGKRVALLREGVGLSEVLGFNITEGYTWADGSSIAPFDKEFYIEAKVSVGGMRDYPDDSYSGGYKKPWTNFAVKALSQFWLAKDKWYPTWHAEKTPLRIDSITVTAL